MRYTLLGLMLLSPSLAFAAMPTLVQHVSGSNTRGNSLSSPFCYYQVLPNPTTGGNAVVVGYTFNGSSKPTVTDDKGDSYTLAEEFYGAQSTQSIGIAAAFNVVAGARRISVCLPSSPVGGPYLAVMATEFANLTAIDGPGTGINSSGTSVSAGNLTPSVANDLIYQITLSTSVNQSKFTAGSQNNIGWNLLSADLMDGLGAQYGVYNSTSVISPTMTMGTSQSFVSAAVLLKSGAAGGVPAGMRIVHLEHTSICGVASCGKSFSNPLALQFPSNGNLIVALAGGGNPVCTMSSLTDSDSNPWEQAGSTYSYKGGGDDTVQIFYAGNANPSSNLSLSAQFTANTCDWSILFYDIAGAANSPLDTTNGTIGYQTTTNGTLTAPYTITPAQPGELIFTNVSWDYNTATGLSLNTGNPYCDVNMFSGEAISGPEPVDQNNGWGHAVSTSNTAMSFTWAQANDTSLPSQAFAAMGAAFKPGSSTGAPAPPTNLAVIVH